MIGGIYWVSFFLGRDYKKKKSLGRTNLLYNGVFCKTLLDKLFYTYCEILTAFKTCLGLFYPYASCSIRFHFHSNSISIFVGYLMPKQSLKKNTSMDNK